MAKINLGEEHKYKLFFTSDTHFNHKNIIEYCNRPFKDEIHMNQSLISNWNHVVPENGIVFLLGDLGMPCSYNFLRTLLESLQGTIYLILGNHDYQNKLDKAKIKDLFEGRVYDVIDLKIHDSELNSKHCKFFMSHYPHLFWQRGSYHLHGHVHSGPNSTASEIVPYHDRRYDVGVDNNNYTPISYTKLKTLFTKRLLK